MFCFGEDLISIAPMGCPTTLPAGGQLFLLNSKIKVVNDNWRNDFFFLRNTIPDMVTSAWSAQGNFKSIEPNSISPILETQFK